MLIADMGGNARCEGSENEVDGLKTPKHPRALIHHVSAVLFE
jgi:hypothetical protein